MIHPHGYKKWKDSKILSFMSSKEGGYEQVFSLINWMRHANKSKSYREQVKEIQSSIGSLKIDRIFLGSDIDAQNQLLVGALNKEKFIRYEDGLYSYYNENRRKPFLHSCFHQIRIYLIKKFSGIRGNVSINTSTASDNPSGIADYMYKPWLLQRYSPNAYEINKEMIWTALRILQNKNLLQSNMQEKSILYLSQPLVEKNFFTLEKELELLKNIMRGIDKSVSFYYKPHPNDAMNKIVFFRKNLPEIKIFDSIEPVELSFASEKNLCALLSYQSTALMYPDKFSQRPIKAISLAKFYKQPMHGAYMEIMKKAGVEFPNTIEETICTLMDSIYSET